MFKINMLYLCQFFYVSTRLIGIPAHQTRPTQIRNIQHNSTTLCRIKTEYRLQEVDLCHKIGENWLYRMLHICRLLTIFDKKLLFRCTPTHSIRFFFLPLVNICISFYSILQVHTPFPTCLVFSYENTPAAQKLLRSRIEFCGRSIPWIKIKFWKRKC